MQIVAPKKVRLADAEEELAKTMEILDGKRAELKAAEDKLDNLKNQFQEMIDKKARLEWQVSRNDPAVGFSLNQCFCRTHLSNWISAASLWECG